MYVPRTPTLSHQACLWLVCLIAFVTTVRGGLFLAHLPVTVNRNLSDPTFRQALLVEVESVLGDDLNDDMRHRISQVEEDLRPMFNALPKNDYGKLEAAAVKYALRRLFVRKNGWSVSGLEAASDAGDTSSLISGDRAPEMVQHIFKRHLGEHGSGLHEVAVLATMMEQLIFEDMLGRLQQAYEAKRLDPEEHISRVAALNVISLYMGSFIRSQDVSKWSTQQVAVFQKRMYQLYPAWKATLNRIGEVATIIAPGLNVFGFDDVARVAAEVSVRFSQWLQDECSVTKDSLVEMEDRDSGRVRLVDFYRAALEGGKYQFTETINFLRQHGTLDESDDLNPKIIIPNYVAGSSNCVARTSYYSVCCLDECEDLFAQIERRLKKPTATVAEIASAVLSTSKMSMKSARTIEGLPELYHRRLGEVATHHRGLVPLHGRLFAQWMHLVFPRMCAYPHKTGSVYYKAIEAWENETGERSGISMGDLEHWTNHFHEISGSRGSGRRGGSSEQVDDHLSGMWSMEEELVVVRPRERARHGADSTQGVISLTSVLACFPDQCGLRGFAWLFIGAVAFWLRRWSQKRKSDRAFTDDGHRHKCV
eukprot:TRINITY_DN62404_c0_g1_i1.p1 TRINITY_DN62404_c0_g1~~TRINITY_DN62404_c0_g1_i1.p1  ORF type:complete len:593 (-),score=74.75 TRINITY_DN62404_c0_g1_i1:59-1837(-)